MSNWNQIHEEVEQTAREVKNPHDAIRHRYLQKFYDRTKRNVVAYYSGWQQKTGPQFSNIVSISDEDKNGFMACFHQMQWSLGLDLFVHSPGGSVAATDSIIHYIRSKFSDDVRVFVPQISMSGGTMMALTGREIWMGTHSNLGPIDPQFGSQPAHLVLSEFERAAAEIKADPDRIHVWRPILAQIQPTFLTACDNAVKWSKEIAVRALQDGMFKGYPDAEARSEKIAEHLSDTDKHKHHSRHIHRDECEAIGLKINNFESDQGMQDAILNVHHAFMITLMETPVAKIIENHSGIFQAKAIGVRP